MLKRLMVEEKGFTLVELLVTISILAVLFGIVTLTLSGVGADAEDTVNDAELGVVQSAVDIAIADNSIASSDLTDKNTADCLDGTEEIGTIPNGSGGTTSITIDGYLRLPGSSSQCEYGWTSGDVFRDTCDCK